MIYGNALKTQSKKNDLLEENKTLNDLFFDEICNLSLLDQSINEQVVTEGFKEFITAIKDKIIELFNNFLDFLNKIKNKIVELFNKLKSKFIKNKKVNKDYIDYFQITLDKFGCDHNSFISNINDINSNELSINNTKEENDKVIEKFSNIEKYMGQYITGNSDCKNMNTEDFINYYNNFKIDDKYKKQYNNNNLLDADKDMSIAVNMNKLIIQTIDKHIKITKDFKTILGKDIANLDNNGMDNSSNDFRTALTKEYELLNSYMKANTAFLNAITKLQVGAIKQVNEAFTIKSNYDNYKDKNIENN